MLVDSNKTITKNNYSRVKKLINELKKFLVNIKKLCMGGVMGFLLNQQHLV